MMAGQYCTVGLCETRDGYMARKGKSKSRHDPLLVFTLRVETVPGSCRQAPSVL